MEVFKSKRIRASLMTGAALGIVCIIGALVRTGGSGGAGFIFALWYNRLLMGMVIGLMDDSADTLSWPQSPTASSLSWPRGDAGLSADVQN